ncbi:N-acetyltransferase [Chimaeribacter arupi]|uniref:N-acetyltransferase n=1 Tax=Chimaeribacter arupi TaxID=2060066 RepID=A0A2N5EIX7_9GAMM|nr:MULTISPECIES: GNAT family N-acetyltransferase [Yersiniaceae]MDV5140939.1 GNAT family N-acetyltransferase [Chimaeribacter arupi]PLR32168.1 N-acetyltransferase [Chimaeribacter arupi]PLR42529.1 N-acetyltransferase [Chimaeribacter arupi]PLR45204.1 N-acetyltransferase [Chimaeribacter arupi]PLR47456.1 N-acetyltransferase [Chimaeribacter arupi]
MLRKMTEPEFAPWAQLFLAEYADDLSANYGFDALRARSEAQQALHAVLPQGVETERQVLLVIEHQGECVGYLWYQRNETNAFIMDFLVLPPFRGAGHGRQALADLETQLAAGGISEVRLRVAADNPRARQLYEACGYHITGHNMSKQV